MIADTLTEVVPKGNALLLLDFLALQDRTGRSWPEHPARDLMPRPMELAEREIYAAGWAAPDGDGFPRLTPHGVDALARAAGPAPGSGA